MIKLTIESGIARCAKSLLDQSELGLHEVAARGGYASEVAFKGIQKNGCIAADHETANSTHRALTFLLDHLPHTLHFVLAGRTEPPLPMARYRARQELMEMRAEQLSFCLEETQTFLQERMGLDLTQDEVLTLHAQIEGWIAGLQLVALSRQRHLAAVEQLAVSGRHRFIADYLQEDVLAPLPDHQRHFLLQTSILDRLCGSLCDAVTGGEGGQTMLETLE